MSELTIPIKEQVRQEFEEKSVDALEQISDILTKQQQEDVEARREHLKMEEAKKQRDNQLYKLFALGEMGRGQYKYLKLKNKLTLMYHKWFVKKKFFRNLISLFKKMSQGAEGFLSKVLKSLFLLAIFDPKGKFLASILGFITNMVVKFIEVFIKWAPILAKRMWNLFTNVLLPALGMMGSKIAEALGFTKGGPMSTIFKYLAQILPVAYLLMGLVSKLMPALNMFSKVISVVTSGMYKLANSIFMFFAKEKALTLKQWAWKKAIAIKNWLWEKKFVWIKWLWKKAKMIAEFVFTKLMNPFALIITAVVALIALVYKFRKQILGFFKNVGKWFMKHIGGFIRPLIKAFKWLAGKVGPILNPIVRFFKWIGSGLMDIFRTIKNFFLDMQAKSLAAFMGGTVNYYTASPTEKKAMEKAAKVQVLASEIVGFEKQDLSKLSRSEQATLGSYLGKTATEEGFQAYSKSGQANKDLKSMNKILDKLHKIEEKRLFGDEERNDKLDEANNLTKEQMRKNALEKTEGFQKLKAKFMPDGGISVAGVVNTMDVKGVM